MNFSDRLRALGFPDYEGYLAAAHWQDFRHRFLIANALCLVCGSAAEPQLHHITYERLGAELPQDVRRLCRTCHMKVHVVVDSVGLRKSDRAIRRLKRGEDPQAIVASYGKPLSPKSRRGLEALGAPLATVVAATKPPQRRKVEKACRATTQQPKPKRPAGPPQRCRDCHQQARHGQDLCRACKRNQWKKRSVPAPAPNAPSFAVDAIAAHMQQLAGQFQPLASVRGRGRGRGAR